ncbi:MAG: hypothetical protein K2Q06_08680 [Parvularculaceae bacterium]|nr:hypothetical protein [Parvularculaceae bacterium]
MSRSLKAAAAGPVENSDNSGPMLDRAGWRARAEYVADFARQLARLSEGPELAATRSLLLKAAGEATSAAAER